MPTVTNCRRFTHAAGFTLKWRALKVTQVAIRPAVRRGIRPGEGIVLPEIFVSSGLVNLRRVRPSGEDPSAVVRGSSCLERERCKQACGHDPADER